MTSIEGKQNEPENSVIIPPGFKILIVDDDEDFREALALNLTLWEIDCFEVESGYEAIEVLQNENFDLILLDFNMPALDGEETFRKISKIKKGAFVIIMTAYPEDEWIEKLKGMKPDGMLEKPFSISGLMPFIKKRIEAGGKE